MKTRTLLTIGASALLVSSFAIADKAENDSVFMTLDKDNNGMITKDEVSSVRKLMDDWSKIDTDNNGTIEKSEFAALESAAAYIPQESEDEPIGAAPTK